MGHQSAGSLPAGPGERSPTGSHGVSLGLSGMASINNPKETHHAWSLVEAGTQFYGLSLSLI